MKIAHTPVEAAPIVFVDRASGSPRVIISGDNARVAFNLSPDEALALAAAIYQECGKTLPLDDGWIPWSGGECPVHPDTRVEYRMRVGITDSAARRAGLLRWWQDGTGGDIIAYRVVTP